MLPALPVPIAFAVRFKGHLVAAVRTGLAREPILLRKRKSENAFVVEIPSGPGGERVARIACARLIKRTEAVRRKIRGAGAYAELRTTEGGRRTARDYAEVRRGRRWKICAIPDEPEALVGLCAADAVVRIKAKTTEPDFIAG